ncbi:hypothetical protein [Streptomyces sp. 8N616]|uniref:hypothetical protein n=1 Tax=Streptomyces sp. 8N616 TaxID=3457414 RepID=UPI003FD1A28A
MKDRTLEALGLADVPAEQPLIYPGRPVAEPGLLAGGELLPLRVRPRRLGAWYIGRRTDRHPGPAQQLDQALSALGQVGTGQRHPVVAVGSNASPAQVRNKLIRLGLPVAVPMVPVRVRGIAVGYSAHIGRAGYVAAAPYLVRDAVTTLVVSWLDAAQLKAVDDTEIHYHRAILPGDRFPLTMPSGERLGGAYIYVSVHGVLVGPDGRPRPGGGDQRELIAALLQDSARLRELLGPDPQTWVLRAAADRELREQGTRIFGEEGRLLPQTDFLPYVDDSAEPRLYDELPPLGDSLSPLA